MVKHIGEQKFASVAEAVAHYYSQGFETRNTGDRFRSMRKPDGLNGFQEANIYHVGLLDVQSHVYSVNH